MEALRQWGLELLADYPEVHQVGLFGSYARGDFCPASDADVVVVVSSASTPIWARPLQYPPPACPVGVEMLVYTQCELRKRQSGFDPWIRHLLDEVIWLVARS